MKAQERGKIGKRAFHISGIFHQAEVLFVVGKFYLILQEMNDIQVCAYRPSELETLRYSKDKCVLGNNIFDNLFV